MRNKTDVVLAVDIGGSKYMVGIIDRSGEIITKERLVWKSKTNQGVVDEILSAIDHTISQNSEYDIQSIGMTIPGLVDLADGLWLTSTKLNIKGLPIVKIVSERFGRLVFIDNDARACALAEKWFGACKECNHFLYVTISTGVGGALVLDGKVYYGGYGNSGEIGQCVVVEDGRIAENGKQGILEGYASTYGLVLNYLEAGGSKTINGEEPNGKLISDLAAQGDKAALRAFELQGHYLGKVIASVLNVLNLEKVVIGGGMSLAQEYFMPTLEETIRREYYAKRDPLAIETTILGYNGAFLGAGVLAFQGLDQSGKK